jgi:hypothetical protein
MEDEMGEACSSDGREEICIQYVFGKRRGRDPLENICKDGKIILNWI